MAVKPIQIAYQARNNTTGLTDVKAQVYLNGAAVAVGGSAVLLTEVDATNSPGLYILNLSAVALAAYGVVSTQRNTISGYINSPTQVARAPFREEVYVSTTDDLAATQGTPAGASISADIAAVKSDTALIQSELVGTNSLANILAAIQAIQNNAGFSIPTPAQLTIPVSGTNAYLIPINIYNSENQLIDPDSNTITVGLTNQAGTDRGSNLTGSSGSPATVAATRVSVGQYTVAFTVQSTALEAEEWRFKFSYAVGGASTVRNSVSTLINDINADGLALQATLLSTQTTVNSNNSLLSNGTFGLSALQTQGATTSTNVIAIQTDLTNNVKGTGFSSSTDTLHQISLAIAAISVVGGRAV